MNAEPRCLCTLEPLTDEGYSTKALDLLADGAPIPAALDFRREDTPKLRRQHAERMSISGVQDKLSLKLEHNKLRVTDTDGGYILKPIPSTQLERLSSDVPANEHLTMLLAREIFDIKAAASALIRMSDGELAYITRRFDREVNGDKLPQEDFCQLLGRTSMTHGEHYKYDAAYEEIFNALENFCPTYRIEREKLFQLLCFNYLVANGDAHLKNFSIYRPNQDYILTPAYDLMSTKLHLPAESRLGLEELYTDGRLAEGETTHGFLTGTDWSEFARNMGIPSKRVARILKTFRDPDTYEAIFSLIERSFLSEDAKREYTSIITDRRRAFEL